jgi:aspartate aminotransferase
LEDSHIIVVNGVAKLYGMTGFRVGWVIAPRQLVRVMTNVTVQTTSGVSAVSQAAAEGALNGLQSVVEALRLQIENNRNVLMQEMRTFPGARLIPPQGTFYAMPDLRAFNGNSVEVSKFLLKKALVVTVPGKEFGMEGHIRLSYAGTVKDVIEGVARIRWALDPSSPNEIFIGEKKMIRDWL